jgi:hypothetical protein
MAIDSNMHFIKGWKTVRSRLLASSAMILNEEPLKAGLTRRVIGENSMLCILALVIG